RSGSARASQRAQDFHAGEAARSALGMAGKKGEESGGLSLQHDELHDRRGIEVDHSGFKADRPESPRELFSEPDLRGSFGAGRVPEDRRRARWRGRTKPVSAER